MRVIVLGSGVVGVATAYYLACDGHEVAVVDRQSAPGMETSFANAGQVSPGASSPWAAPGIPLKALRWLAMRHRPLVLWPLLDRRLYGWLARLLANCTQEAFDRNKSRMLRLAEYSRDALRTLRTETGIAYDERTGGTLELFRSQAQLDAAGRDTAVLDRFCIPYELLDVTGCIAREPGLADAAPLLAGGLRLPGDETGDAHLFTLRLAELCETKGVHFRLGVAVARLHADEGTLNGIVLATGEVLRADAYVVAAGSFTSALLRPLGLEVPVYPVKGYSLTAAVTDPAMAPASTVMDETYKVAITRLGDRVRIGGTAELAGFDLRLRRPRRATLEHSVCDLFPRGCDPATGSFWTGLRPMTPDGTPLVGATRVRGLYLNTGHGTLGWTMACGSGRFLADVIGGKKPDLDPADLALERYAAE